MTYYSYKKSGFVANYCSSLGIEAFSLKECFIEFEEFEGITVGVPIGYHQLLEQVYGDYMKLLPE